MNLEELKLPDHIFSRSDGSVTILERESGNQRSLSLPARARIVEKKSMARYLGAIASAVFVIYFASMFVEILFTTTLELAILPVLIAVPFIIDRVGGGRAAIAGYLIAFFAFALLRGGMATGSLRLGLIFFGGSPVDYQGYAIVPASDILTALILGLLPFGFMNIIGQAVAKYGIVFGSAGEEYTIWVRHKELVGEILRFLDRSPSGPPINSRKSGNTSI